MTAEGLRAASACAEVSSELGLTVVSGYARGVDMAAHIAALNADGRTVIVLPEGVRRFRVKRGEFGRAWDPTRVLVISQFPPNQPWNAGSAMARNTVIVGLGLGLVVIEAGETGGTLNAGLRALELNRPVVTLEFADQPRGNAVLIRRGATAAGDRTQLTERLRQLRTDCGHQLRIF